MTRNLKALGLALLATFALGAVAASGASAEVAIFEAETELVDLTGQQDGTDAEPEEAATGTQIFRLEPAGIPLVTCHGVSLEGTSKGTKAEGNFTPGVTAWETDTITLLADYTVCTGPNNSNVDVDFTTGKCGYHFTGTKKTTADATLFCEEEGGSVTLTPTVFGFSICTVHIPPQEPGGHVLLHNVKEEGSASHAITAEADIEGITFDITGGGGICGPVGEGHEGTYTGNSIITGYKHNSEHIQANNVGVTVTHIE